MEPMIYENYCIGFWGIELNKGEDKLSSPDRHIHLSQSPEQ